MRTFLMGAAALALAAGAAAADPGQGKGNSGDKRGGPPAAQMDGKPDKAARNGGPKADGGSQEGPERAAVARAQGGERGPPAGVARGADKREAGPPPHADRGKERAGAERRDERERGVDRRASGDRRAIERIDDDRHVRRLTRTADFDFRANRGLIDGCPPGLAKKRNGCMPPGLLKDRRDDFRYRQAFYRPEWWGFGSTGERLYYDDGYLYRLGSDNLVRGYIPLLGGALSLGNVWPSAYQPVPVPAYYVDYYNLGRPDSYRYADNVLYRVDPQTAAITSIAALLTGDQITVGQPVPLGYDVYNVPYPYRDRYYDTPDAWYRYSDGYIYQIDPATQLVAAAIQMLL